MAAETTGFNITVSCTQDATIAFNCKAKKRPGIQLASKVDVTTDHSGTAREYEPGCLMEITDGQLSVPDDPVLEAKILNIIGKKGTIFFNSKTTGQRVGYSNAWFSSYTPESMSIGSDQPMAILAIQSAGGVSLPEISTIPEEPGNVQ